MLCFDGKASAAEPAGNFFRHSMDFFGDDFK